MELRIKIKAAYSLRFEFLTILVSHSMMKRTKFSLEEMFVLFIMSQTYLERKIPVKIKTHTHTKQSLFHLNQHI